MRVRSQIIARMNTALSADVRSWRAILGTHYPSDQPEIHRRGGGKHALQLLGRQSPKRGEQSAEHAAVLIQNRIVAVLEELGTLDSRLPACNAAAAHAAAENPVDRPVTVVGSLVPVLA